MTKINHSSILAVVSCAMPPPALQTLKTVAHTILLPADPLLPPPVASHPDMLLFPIGDTLVVHRQYYGVAQREIDTILSLTGMTLCLTDAPRGPVYPMDVGLNGLIVGAYLLGRLDTLAPEILSVARSNHITPISVKQGYTGCSALVVGTAICSADPSIHKAALSLSLPFISVPDQCILLPGYDHGFFGGCGGCVGDTVFLCGTPDPVQYQTFLHYTIHQSIQLHCLYDGPLWDCGGIRLFHL